MTVAGHSPAAYTSRMATYSITEAQERLPDLLDRASQGEEVVIRPEFGEPVVLRPVRREGAPMTGEDVAWVRARRVPLGSGPTSVELVRAMRDED